MVQWRAAAIVNLSNKLKFNSEGICVKPNTPWTTQNLESAIAGLNQALDALGIINSEDLV